ncbi:MAG: 5-formyltetrahydrofolate cyclo-ligase [Sandaracinaceae bacterium]|nr:MAG: 5-formyltetrahydrofolate cyclo-ligase [Sandaracinaceae bacterium]HBQ14505.1 5-formyltetrahydrofolate cyclo-ligase [Myxococcales bacterium]
MLPRMEEPDESWIRAQVKAEIRTRRLATRRALPREANEKRSRAICERIMALPEWERARTVLAFVSMPREVQTRVAVEAAWTAGKQIATTRLSRSDPGALELCEWTRDTPLEESGMMFLQPPRESPLVADDAIDLVLVPALAVDARGHRIGFGKGFYDRLLPRLTNAFRVAVAFDFEQIAEVPNVETDAPVHAIVTDEKVLRVE